MTHNSNPAPIETSRFNEFVGSALTAIVLVLFSVVSVASFVHI
jgi:hypothetical protein